jgi:hypothetical protein
VAVDEVCRDTVERWELEYALEPGSSKGPLCTFVVFELDLSP